MPSMEKFANFSATIRQTTTRGDMLKVGEEFIKEEIDFNDSLEHLKIHHEGKIAGSLFNNEIIKNPKDVEILIKKLLPDKLNYDQFKTAEITLDISHALNTPLGWSGVKSLKEIQELFPEAKIEKTMRMPGGESAIEDNVKGAWYPQTGKNETTGKMEVLKDVDGNIKNPKGKFEPEANIATVKEDDFKNIAKTNLITIIIRKDKNTSKPSVITIYPGDNAPMFPAKINSENYKLNTLKEGQSSDYWDEHAFIQIEK